MIKGKFDLPASVIAREAVGVYRPEVDEPRPKVEEWMDGLGYTLFTRAKRMHLRVPLGIPYLPARSACVYECPFGIPNRIKMQIKAWEG